MRRSFLAYLIAGTVSGLGGTPGLAQSRVNSLVSENDNYQLNRTDRHYTNGIRFSTLGTTRMPISGARRLLVLGLAPWSVSALARSDSASGGLRSARLASGWTIGQNIYTPANLNRQIPDSSDRPYAAWLFYGWLGALTSPSGALHHDYELDIGVTGPPALGEPAQRLIHRVTSDPPPRGWSRQIRTRFGALAKYQLQYRLIDNAGTGPSEPARRRWIDLTPRIGYALGNIMTYATAGATLRLGFNISDRWPGDPGRMLSDRAAPQLGVPGMTTRFRAGKEGSSGGLLPSMLYAFVAPDVRAVAWNVFLRGPAPLMPKALVADLAFGFTAGWRRFRVSYQLVHRTREYFGQQMPDHYGSVDMSWWH